MPEPATFPRHLVSIRDLSRDQVDDLFTSAAELRVMPRAQARTVLAGLTLAVMFFQPSTRTRLGFEAAGLRLGASVTGFADPTTTRSVDYIGESLEDAVQVVANLADIIVLRHFLAGAGRQAALVSSSPVVNGGDGSNEHPTQALSDGWLMASRLGGLDGAIIGIVGDPGTRVHRSLALLLAQMRVAKILFVIPPSAPLRLDGSQTFVHTTLPGDIRAALQTSGVGYEFRSDVTELLAEADAIEMMPVDVPALEADPRSLSKYRSIAPERYRITAAKIRATASTALVLHPGPRKDELHPDVDDLPNGLYFDQVRESLFMRMAVLAHLCAATPWIAPPIATGTPAKNLG